jgi:alpha-glucuronidase
MNNTNYNKIYIPILLLLFVTLKGNAETGYDLWLRYQKIDNQSLLKQYNSQINSIYIASTSPTAQVIQKEISTACFGLLSKKIVFTNNNANIIFKRNSNKVLGEEGYSIKTSTNKKQILIEAQTDIGLLYGCYHFIKLLQTHQSIQNLNIVEVPKLKLRILNHWDNLNRTVERGYAGFSIWNWHTLPHVIEQRYIDYARANASIGINGVVLNNVNANATILTTEYLEKVQALANTFKPYGIKVYLTARFSAPIEIGKLKTADPLDANVQTWWNNKTNEIYNYIPNFGGFLVKANSEGQPGPQDYKRTHADGANMLAKALAPHNGIVMWRAFVYSHENADDRHKQAYADFKPLDGKFDANVIVQVKNGAIDFMPREPFHPLFGAMPKTPLMMEFQITQEYLGQATNLVYLAPLYKEVLEADTYCNGKGSTVAKVIDGSMNHHTINGIAGVANIGNDINWCGHPFAQANWYAFGKLSWNYELTSQAIAEEWIRMTYSNNPSFIKPVLTLMLQSRETYVQFTQPLGLHHIMGTSHHYGPAPWVSHLSRPEWNPVYYHKADSIGLGFDRTTTGSNAISQYFTNAAKKWQNVDSCPSEYLLWFHHVPWNYQLASGRNLWNELCYQYYNGTNKVKEMIAQWQTVKTYIDEERFIQVYQLLNVQYKEAIWWRNACLLYFQTFSKMTIPAEYEQPDKSLEYYKKLEFPFAPGI